MPENDYLLNKLLRPHVLPPIPLFLKNGVLKVTKPGKVDAESTQAITDSERTYGKIDADTVQGIEGDKIEQTIFGTPQVVPLQVKLKSESDYWLFPVEPIISIDGKSILIKRNVAKKIGKGSIKEYWAEDDWVINVQGVLTTINSEKFPDADFKQLIKYLTAKDSLDVKCPALERLGITRIVIEERSLPFTKGPENQNFSFKALSDDVWKLLIDNNTNVL